MKRSSNVLLYNSGEKKRWEKRIIDIEKEDSMLWVESLLHSAFVTYLGSQNEQKRKVYKNKWLSLLRDFYKNDNFDLFKFHGKHIITWKQLGLADDLSLENAVVIASGSDKV